MYNIKLKKLLKYHCIKGWKNPTNQSKMVEPNTFLAHMENFLPFSRGVKQRAEFTAELYITTLQEPRQQNITPSQLVGLVPLGKVYSSSVSPECE